VTIEGNIENNRALVRRQFEEVINRNMSRPHSLTAILPCNDLDASEAFYARLGFTHREGDDDYRMLSDGRGGELHLTAAVEGWLVPGRNPFGLLSVRRGGRRARRADGLSCRGQALGDVRVRRLRSRRDPGAGRLADQAPEARLSVSRVAA
jgi:hypothetical protein